MDVSRRINREKVRSSSLILSSDFYKEMKAVVETAKKKGKRTKHIQLPDYEDMVKLGMYWMYIELFTMVRKGFAAGKVNLSDAFRLVIQ